MSDGTSERSRELVAKRGNREKRQQGKKKEKRPTKKKRNVFSRDGLEFGFAVTESNPIHESS